MKKHSRETVIPSSSPLCGKDSKISDLVSAELVQASSFRIKFDVITHGYILLQCDLCCFCCVFTPSFLSFNSCLKITSVNLGTGRHEALKGHPLKDYYGAVQSGRVLFCLNQKQQPKRLDKLSLSLSYKPLSNHISRSRSASFVCLSALFLAYVMAYYENFSPFQNARCGAEGQTQTMEKPTSVIQNAPGKEKSPQIDDGGTGLPPRDDDGGGGGGGGGGGNFSGGFFFFGFLAFLGFLKDKESEGDYRDSRR
ncbi:hypothetical protein KSS87_012600 [Heliosperma pusillum]|nr:hypothetical protein KSS87_012600 [Heliosperma pusillum]